MAFYPHQDRLCRSTSVYTWRTSGVWKSLWELRARKRTSGLYTTPYTSGLQVALGWHLASPVLCEDFQVAITLVAGSGLGIQTPGGFSYIQV